MRIRTIKPSFFSSESVAEVSRDARLLFAGLFCYVDDEGRQSAKPALLKAALFPLDDDIGNSEIEAMLAELEAAELVVLYEVDGRSYLAVPKFRQHQRVSKPKPSERPAPPEKTPETQRSGTVADESRNGRGAVADEARGEGKGREGKGREASPPSTDVFKTQPSEPEAEQPAKRVDHRRTIRSAVGLVANRQAELSTKPISNLDAWVGKAAGDIQARHGQAMAARLDRAPDLTPEALARAEFPTLWPEAAAQREPEPEQVARRRYAERQQEYHRALLDEAPDPPEATAGARQAARDALRQPLDSEATA